jgi:hypothetical protein
MVHHFNYNTANALREVPEHDVSLGASRSRKLDVLIARTMLIVIVILSSPLLQRENSTIKKPDQDPIDSHSPPSSVLFQMTKGKKIDQFDFLGTSTS